MNFDYTFSVDGGVDIGKKRSLNQDEIILLSDNLFFAVSDGMGGFISGGETSQMIKEAFGEIMKVACEELSEAPSPQRAKEILKEKILSLNESIYTKGKESGPDSFGATLSGVWLIGDSAVFVNIGDSRGYIFMDNVLRQVTKDHNLADYLVEHGELTKEEARHHPSTSHLLKYIGMKPPATPDIFVEKLTPGCEMLLCSDGLYGMLEDEDIAKILSENGQIIEKLINAANANGGKDNISVVHITVKSSVGEQQ
jgi:serine/threonine protein phosphatase PrpC